MIRFFLLLEQVCKDYKCVSREEKNKSTVEPKLEQVHKES